MVSAFFADVDVTSKVTTFKSGNNIVIDTTDLVNTFGGTDPYPGLSKTLNVLFTNGTAYRVFNAVEYSGQYTLAPFGSASASNCVDTFFAPNTAITAVFSAMWGKGQNTVQNVYTNFNWLIASKNIFTCSNALFGNQDTFYGTKKTGVVWYSSGGAIAAKAVIEFSSYNF
jgi:hypothetical protein